MWNNQKVKTSIVKLKFRGIMTKASNSHVQTTKGQSAILEFFKTTKFPDLIFESEITLPDGNTCKVDGSSIEGKALIEVYSRVGKLHGAQPKKIGTDILKLSTIRKVHPDWKDAKLIIAFADSKAMQSISGWLNAAAKQNGVDLELATIDNDLRMELEETQKIQRMVNVEMPEEDFQYLKNDKE